MKKNWQRWIVIGVAVLVVVAFGLAAVLSVFPGTIGDEAGGATEISVTAAASDSYEI